MAKNTGNRIGKADALIALAETMVHVVIALITGNPLPNEILKRLNMMSRSGLESMIRETTDVSFVCPECDEKSEFKSINGWAHGFGIRYIEAECSVCHTTVRLRFTSNRRR